MNRSKMVVLLVRLGVILGMEIKNPKMYIVNFGQNLMVMAMVMVLGVVVRVEWRLIVILHAEQTLKCAP